MRQWGVQPEHTFDELMVAYLKATSDTMRDPERATYAIQRLMPFFTGRVLERLRRSDVSAYIEKRKADKVGPYTVNRELDLLSAAINYARKHWEWDIQNPVSGMSLRQPEGRLRWLSRAEADVLIREAEKEPKSPHLADFIRLALNTGCRKNELLKLSWDRVDLKANVLRLEGEHTKSGKRRAVPLNDEAQGVFESRPLSCGALPGFRPGIRAPEREAHSVHAERVSGGVHAGQDQGLPGSRSAAHLRLLARARRGAVARGREAPRPLDHRDDRALRALGAGKPQGRGRRSGPATKWLR